MSWCCERRRALLALLALLAACQPLPRPFQPDAKPAADFTAFDGVADKLVIFVAGVEGAPAAFDRALVPALVEGLHARGIAASDRVANRASYLLAASARVDGADGPVLGWRLIDADGLVVGLVDQRVPTGGMAWTAAGPALAAAVAEQAAPRLAAVIADAAAPAPAAPPAVTLAAVEGAPGGGARLEAAMRAALARLGVAVVDAPGDGRPVVRGRVARRPHDGGELVEIRWTVEAAGGSELGEISQSNLVPARALDGDWAMIAPQIAEGAAEGVRTLLDELARTER